jgi:hypothetical protein
MSAAGMLFDWSSSGRGFFQELPAHMNLRRRQALRAPGVTHLQYEVVR